MKYPGLTTAESAALDSVAKDLSTNPEWLWEVMNFESRLNPKAANPKSSAKGLIQFLDSTAKGMGYTSSQDLVNKHPTFTSQLKGPVRAYFLAGKPYATRQKLYMKVFYPAAMTVPPDTTFKKLYDDRGANYNSFAKANPGIVTVADYVNKALKNARAKWPIATVKTATAISGGLVFLAAAATAYFFITSGTGKAV